MKPYGLNLKEYGNDSKRAGDLFNGRKSLSGIGVRAYLRSLKKKARRHNKFICRSENEQS